VAFFRRRVRDPEESAGLVRVEAWARAALADPGVEVLVRQIDCADPGCADLLTVILISAKGRKSRAVSLVGRACDLTEAEVAAALAD
jgi:hypothetical protein